MRSIHIEPCNQLVSVTEGHRSFFKKMNQTASDPPAICTVIIHDVHIIINMLLILLQYSFSGDGCWGSLLADRLQRLVHVVCVMSCPGFVP